jgi:hypothetical protein
VVTVRRWSKRRSIVYAWREAQKAWAREDVDDMSLHFAALRVWLTKIREHEMESGKPW